MSPDRLTTLRARHERAEAKAAEARNLAEAAKADIGRWADEQVARALAKRGITPGKSVVRMDVRREVRGRIRMETQTVLLRFVADCRPPAHSEQAASARIWWCRVGWQGIRKTDGKPGAARDFVLAHGDTPADLAAKIEHVRDLDP